MTYLKPLAVVLGLTLTTVLGPSSYAQTKGTAETNELTAVFECRDVTDAMKRLACYDNAVGRFEEAQEQGEIVTISKKQVEAVEKDSFGFNLPSLPSLGGLFKSSPKSNAKRDNPLTDPVGETKTVERTEIPKTVKPPVVLEESTIKEVELNIEKTQTFGYKKIRFFLENGQVWEQVDTRNIRVPKVRNGNANTVKIQKASLGSFLLRVNGKGSAIRVRRVR